MTDVVERWASYVLHEGDDLVRFWSTRLASGPRDVLLVLGHGFDPRMCLAAETLMLLGGKGRREALLLEFDEGAESSSQAYASMVAENERRLEGAFAALGAVRRHAVQMVNADRRRISSRSAALVFKTANDLNAYTDVVIDVSALPRSIYFPLIAKTLFLIDQLAASGRIVNLHVFVGEDPSLDQRIVEIGIDDAEYVHQFRGGIDLEATATHPRLWLPLLGEGQEAKLQRINDLVRPDEICPVLPFPSTNPRRADNLVIEYHRLLFDEFRVEPGNFIYASESNPFQVYRHMRRAILQYVDALAPLGSCKVVLSSLTSKVLSVGALLVAYELKEAKMTVGIAQVEVQGYGIQDPAPTQVSAPTRLVDIWIAGDCYARSTREN